MTSSWPPTCSSARGDARMTSCRGSAYGVVVRGADPSRFRALGRCYWTDDRRVWVDDGKVPVTEADAASFLVADPHDPRIGRDEAGDATDRNRS